ncbi:MAG TPA: DUF4389 domain-containing protein [Solirubrobacteraceae bacterium]|nr:DUF4389 domain-containing protein [Solirubrobacteraceae bacterium]
MENKSTSSPVRLEGRLEEPLNRWLWLVKWLLLIPHFIALLVLWLCFLVLSLIALGGILVNRRYPRGIFDFNLGVLRWSWRVSFYGYSALATDRYPPFSLGEEPDYPARLQIAYPGELSRVKALTKWWLLAIPQYAVIGVFSGGWGAQVWGPGLIGLLVLFAAVAVLFGRPYPRGIFDFATGMNRWTMRVLAYAALMTDSYPPFRLDLGPAEPTGNRTDVPAPSPIGDV